MELTKHIIEHETLGIKDQKPVIAKTYAELDAMRLAGTIVVGQEYSFGYDPIYVQKITNKLKWGKYDYDTITEEQKAEVREYIVITGETTSSFNINAHSTKYSGEEVLYDFNRINVVEHVELYRGTFNELEYYDGRGILVNDGAGNYYSLKQRYSMAAPLSDTDTWQMVFTEADNWRPGFIYGRVSTNGKEIVMDYRNILHALFRPNGKQTSQGFHSAPYDIEDFDGDRKDKFTLDFTGIVPADLSSKYFTFSSKNTKYYIWFNALDGASTDPNPAGYTMIQVDYNSTTDTISDVVGKVIIAMSVEFTASHTDALLSMETADNGAVLEAPTAGDTAAVLNIVQTGTATVAGKYYKKMVGATEFDLYWCARPYNSSDITDLSYFARVYWWNEDPSAVSGYFFPTDFTPRWNENYHGLSNESIDIDIDNYQEFYTVNSNAIDRLDNSDALSDSQIGNVFDYDVMTLVMKETSDNLFGINIINGVTGYTITGRNLYNIDLIGMEYILSGGEYRRHTQQQNYHDNVFAFSGVGKTKCRLTNCYFGGDADKITAFGDLQGLMVLRDCNQVVLYGETSSNILLDFYNQKCDSVFSNNRYWGGLHGGHCGYYTDNNRFNQIVRRVVTGSDFRDHIGEGEAAVGDLVVGNNVGACTFRGFNNNTISSNISGRTFEDGISDSFDYGANNEYHAGNCFVSGVNNKAYGLQNILNGLSNRGYAQNNVALGRDVRLYGKSGTGAGVNVRNANAYRYQDGMFLFADDFGNYPEFLKNLNDDDYSITADTLDTFNGQTVIDFPLDLLGKDFDYTYLRAMDEVEFFNQTTNTSILLTTVAANIAPSISWDGSQVVTDNSACALTLTDPIPTFSYTTGDVVVIKFRLIPIQIFNNNNTTDFSLMPIAWLGLDNIWHSADSIDGPKFKITAEGGYAIRLTNKTGADSVKGYVVDASSTNDNAVQLVVDGVPDAFGIIYEDGIADGSEVWVVTSGIADVYYIGSTVRKDLARTFISAEAGYVAGQAMSEPFPAPPFASDKHFCEIGHVIESRTGAGLAKTLIHFN